MTELEKKSLCRKLGQNIKSTRLKAGITQIEFSKLLDLSRPSVVNIENGRQLPPLNVIFDIAKILNAEVEELLRNISITEQSSELEESSKKIIDSWKKSEPDVHTEDTILTVEEFIKDTNQIPND